MSLACPLPKRKSGSCFRCGSTQHKLFGCPKPARADRRVALVEGDLADDHEAIDEERCHHLSAINKVRVAFVLGKKIQKYNVMFSLFDTGSPISLIRFSEVPDGWVNSPIKLSGYQGLCASPLPTYGDTTIYVQFQNVSKPNQIFVVPDSCLPYSVLLGQCNNEICDPKSDIINKRSAKVLHCAFSSFSSFQSDSDIVFSSVQSDSEQVFSSVPNDSERANIPSPSDLKDPDSERCSDHPLWSILAIEPYMSQDEFDINPVLNDSDRAALQSVIYKNYIDLKNIPERKHDYKMHIRLSSEVPISFAPRRPSYADKKVVDTNIEELLRLGFIRPSDSAYAFPLV